MKAILTKGGGRIYCAETAMPVLGEFDCLVKMRSCLFCNSTDRHIVENSFEFGLTYPCVLGHESIGEVVEVGSAVCNFKDGDIVARSYSIYPDETQDGLGSGWGGFAEYGKIRDFRAMVDAGLKRDADVPGFFRYMQKMPAGLTAEKAILISSQKEILSATRKIGVYAGRSFLVAGTGIAGLLFAKFLRLMGASDVTVTARRPEALEFAARMTGAKILTLTEALGGKHVFDALVESTGDAGTAELLIRSALRPDGDCYGYAIYSEMRSEKNLHDRLRHGRNYIRIDPSEAEAHDEVCAMLLDGTLDPEPFISFRFKVTEAESAWCYVIGKRGVKTAVVFD